MLVGNLCFTLLLHLHWLLDTKKSELHKKRKSRPQFTLMFLLGVMLNSAAIEISRGTIYRLAKLAWPMYEYHAHTTVPPASLARTG